MPGGKKSKELRREAVKTPLPPQGAPRRQASPKVLLSVAAAIVALGVGIALVAILSGGGSSTPSITKTVGSLEGALPGAADVYKLFKGIPQNDNVLGSPKAPVTMVEYIDLQCPYCREFETAVLPTLIAGYVRSGHVRVELQILAFIGPDSERGRSAVIAAGFQGRMFDFMDLLYFNQGVENKGWLSSRMVDAVAQSIPGLAVQPWLTATTSATAGARASKFDADATAAHVNSTPTIFVGPTGGALKQVELTTPTDGTGVTAAIEAASR